MRAGGARETVVTIPRVRDLPQFDRRFFDGRERFTRIGEGALGGKANGLLLSQEIVLSRLDPAPFAPFEVAIPRMTVIATDCFDAFVARNRLEETARSDMPDDRLANAFMRAELPAELLGDLRALVEQVHTPLAVRSSSLLEDALFRPFAGVYATKMIPNNQPDADTRFRRLVEAVKFVYASTFFREAKAYRSVAGQLPGDEKMAVIVQEVVGRRRGDRYYPQLSGVARSYNFYRMGNTRPEEGVVELALGLGKTIVDGGLSWSYCPARPRVPPPFASASATLDSTQSEFWAVNMGKPPAYDPIRETEYLVRAGLADAEMDGTLALVASTYDAAGDRLTPGVGVPGPRAVTFAPILSLGLFPLNDLLRRLLSVCEEAVGEKVEMEFAAELDAATGAARFGFLQLRPLPVSHGYVDVGEDELSAADTVVGSDLVLGNGEVAGIRDVIYVRPDRFEARLTPRVAEEVAAMDRELTDRGRPYLLIGFGRWGSSDPWLGIPVVWAQIGGAKAIVEASLPQMNVEPSQGSHFFHNLTSFQVSYFCVRHDRGHRLNWEWLDRQPAESETDWVRHVRSARPLVVRVDGRTGRGVVRVLGDEP